MKLTLDNAVLQEAIRIVTRLAPPITGNVAIESNGKKLYLHSASELNRCSINLPCELEGKPALFAIDVATLRDATKGRKEMNILFEKTVLKISSGNFKVELPTSDALERESEKVDDDSTEYSITQEQATWLRSAIGVVALRPAELITSYMPLYIKLHSKGVFVSCFDSLHLAYLSSKEITGDMEVAMPLDVMSAVLDTFDKTAFKLSLSQSALTVKNKLVNVSLSLPSDDKAPITGPEVVEKAKEISKVDGNEVVVARSEVLAFLDNASAVATRERSELVITTTKGKVKFEVATTNGVAKAIVKATSTVDTKSKIDFDFFDEAVRKSTEEVSMKIVDDSFIAFKIKNATVLVALNQDSE